MRRPVKRVLIAALLVLVLAWAATGIVLPYFVIRPGEALVVGERVTFGGSQRQDPLSGRFLLTTVALSQPSAVGFVEAWIDDDLTLLPRDEVIPSGSQPREYFQAQRKLFAESTRIAAAVGLRAAHRDVTITGDGARVAAIVPGSPADGKLHKGDVIVRAAGMPVHLTSDVIAVATRREPGDRVRLEVRRDGELSRVTVGLERSEQLERPRLGIAVRTVDLKIHLPFSVDVESGRIGGPSAGLMVALTVYDLAQSGDLTRGRTVAGTGTIDTDGHVGPVGGVSQKVEAAVEAGAAIFLVPSEEAAEARSAANGRLRVVEVKTLDQAVAALR
ncbi:MAG: PDZ domain-containing protein [Carbonactinosporaceae bacterium]